MSSDGASAGRGPRRLHPAGIAVLALGALRGAALPLLAVFVAGVAGGGLDTRAMTRALVLGTAGAVFAAVAGVVAWATTTWRIGAGTLHHRRGLLSVRETDIPLARVQAVDTVRGPVQRLFGVVGVHVQTAGGGRDGEIVLPALSAADVEALHDAVGARPAAATGPEGEPVPAHPQRRLDGRALLVAALTAGRLGVLLPALAASTQLADELFGDDLEEAGRAGAGLVPHTALEWALLGAGLLLVGWLLSAAAAAVAFAGFTVTREPGRLRIARGLLARREASVPVARIQAVHVVESMLRQPWKLALLRIDVAGYKDEEAAAQTLFPLLPRAQVRELLAQLLPELADDADGGLEPVPRRAARRYVLWPVLAALPVAGGAAVALAPARPWLAPVVAASAALGWLRYRDAGWRLADGRLVVRSRRLARTTILAPAKRVQQHGLRQTVLQRRAGLADVDLRIGAGTHGRVRHLDAAVAARLFDALRASPTLR